MTLATILLLVSLTSFVAMGVSMLIMINYNWTPRYAVGLLFSLSALCSLTFLVSIILYARALS